MTALRAGRQRFPGLVAIAASFTALLIGIRWGTFVAGGSDSHCYLAQARSLAAGRTDVDEPLAAIANWPGAARTLVGAGYIPSPRRLAASAPICPPGLSIAMAPFVDVQVAGRSAAFFVVPIFGAIAVWLTFLIGRRLCGPAGGAMSALLLTTSPIFLYQLVQPMSDVPAAAWWLLAAVLGSDLDFLAGLAASAAIVTRPNLLPLAGVIALFTARRGRRRLTFFLAGLAPGVVGIAVFNAVTFGSVTSTGYGSASDLFSLAHVVPNLWRYTSWLLQAHTPVLALALLGPLVTVPDTSARLGCLAPEPGTGVWHPRSIAWLGLAMTATTLACYLPYLVFDEWSYSRFLLPAIPFLIVLAVTVIRDAVQRVTPRYANLAAALICAALAVSWLSTATRLRAFELKTLEGHFEEAGKLVASRTPPNAAVLTVAYSGSVRFYSGRPIVLWNEIEPEWLDRVLTTLELAGYEPFLLFDAGEEPAFKARFRNASAAGALDWPFFARAGVRATLYDPADRGRFFRGESLRR